MLEVLTNIPGVLWPAIPGERPAQLLAMQFQLEQSQWLSPEQLRTQQFRQLTWLLQHAHATVPFYRERLDRIRFDPAAPLTYERWRQLPYLTRRDIQLAGESLYCSIGPKEHGQVSKTATSGSSGQPVVTLGNTVTRLFFAALVLRQHIWHKRDLSLKLAAIRAARQTPDSPVETASEGWGPAAHGIVQVGPSVCLDIHTSIEQQEDFLLRHDPDYLITYPSVLFELARRFEASRQRLGRLREVRTFGEVLDQQVRQKCQAVFGVPLVDSYSAEEVGEIATQCPSCEDYHVHAENVLVEVLRDDGTECGPGEIGSVVITTLHNTAMPLLRYDIGDFAEVGEPCPCGRGLPVLKRILGRQRNLFILPDGRRIWPSFELRDGESMPPIFQYQLIQRSRHELELLVVAPRTFSPDEEAFARLLVARSISPDMSLKITYVDSIPRGRTGKFEDFRCEIGGN